MPRTFDGTADEIVTSLSAQMTIPFGTMVAVLKRNESNVGTVCSIHKPSGTAGMSMDMLGTGGVRWLRTAATGSASPGVDVVDADNWVFIAAAKATGTVVPDFWDYVYDTRLWTTDVGGATVTDVVGDQTGGTVRFGQLENGGFFGGDIAAVAYFDRKLTDTEVRRMPWDLHRWLDNGPVGMWVFDQKVVTQPIHDWTGNGSDQISIVGTTISNNVAPIGYGVIPTYTSYPKARLRAAASA